MTQLPLFQYPLSIVSVDDDQVVLDTVSLILKSTYKLKTFLKTDDALSFFKNYSPFLKTKNFFRGCIDHDYYETANNFPVDINMQALDELRSNPERYDEIAVLIVDYNMPDMTGIDFCRKLQGLPMKKILLTGEAGHSKAVAAFNDGIIDRYVRKDSSHMSEEISLFVKILSEQYLVDASKHLFSHLELDHPLPISDRNFIKFFKEWCQANQIREYYLFDKFANLTVVDKNGKPAHFVVHTDKTLQDFVDLYNDNKSLGTLIDDVIQRKKIPFFGIGKEAWQFETSEWEKYFYSPETFEGNQKYYWTLIG